MTADRFWIILVIAKTLLNVVNSNIPVIFLKKFFEPLSSRSRFRGLKMRTDKEMVRMR